MPVRHLLIANGGTGARIASEVVEQFVAERGELPENVAVAVIDARSRPEYAMGSRNVFMLHRPQPLNFPSAHDRLRTDTGRYRPHHLSAWWPTNVAPSAEVTFTDGCGADRPNGRFFATYFDSDIAATLDKAIHALMAVRGSDGTQPVLNIYLCASLGNGTGGGSFMQVATIANALASRSGMEPRIVGFFVPSTTTAPSIRAHSDRILTPRVGANGLAALIELQYEFNREFARNGSTVGWSRHPRVEEGPLTHHGIANDYACSDPYRSPFMQCYLIDTQNATAHIRTYQQVVGVASRVIYSTLSGADEDFRILDVNRHAPGPFGSIGFVRVRSPMTEGRSYMTLRIRQVLADRLLTPNTDADHSVLRIQGGNHAPSSGSVEASVGYFIRQIAAIEETDLTDQLLARMREVLPEDPAANRTLTVPRTPAEMDAFRSGIESHMRTCRTTVAEWVDRALNGTGGTLNDDALSRMSPEQQLEAERGLGIRSLLRRKVIEPLVLAGEFGLLHSWLEQFKIAVAACRTSVNRVEYHRVQHTGAGVDSSVEEYIAEAQEYFDHLLSIIYRGKVADLLQTAGSKLIQYMRDGREFVVVSAALSLYSTLENDVDRLLAVVRGVRDEIARELFTSDARRRLEAATGALDATQSRTDSTLELVLGGRVDVEDAVEEALHLPLSAQDGVASALYALRDLHRAILVHVGQQMGVAGVLSMPRNSPSVPSSWSAHYVARLETKLEEHTNNLLVRHLSLAALLEARCRRVVEEYIEVGLAADHAGSTSLDRVARQTSAAAEALFSRQFGEVKQELLAVYDPQARSVPPAVREGLVQRAIGCELRRLAAKAVVCWRRNHDPDNHVTRHTVIVMRELHGGAVKAAVQELQTEGDFHVNERLSNDPNRIDFLSVESGAYLEQLTQSLVLPHEKHYEDSMNPNHLLGRGFCPHTSIEYLEAGRSFLTYLTGGRGGHRIGAGLLALAMASFPDREGVFAYVEEQNGSFKVARQINDGVVRAAAGRALDGRGLATVIAHLDGAGYDTSSAEGRARFERAEGLRTGLADVLWRDLQALIYGSGQRANISPVGLEKVVEWITGLAAEADIDAMGAKNDAERAQAFTEQSRQLTALATALRVSRAEERPMQLST